MHENIDLNYRQTLLEYFQIRKEINSSYSLRSYARDLEIPFSNLCNVLQGKQGLSKISAEKIAKNLRIKGQEKLKFVDTVLASDARSKKEKILAKGRVAKYQLNHHKKIIQEDYFKLISEWYYYTILELMVLDSFKSDHRWLAKNLSLDISTVDHAMKRLMRLNLIRFENGEYVSTGVQLETLNDIPSNAIKKHNIQILNMASKAIIEQETEEREIATLTVAINTDDIQFIKEQIRQFKKRLDQELVKRSKEKGANRVYCLAIQFFDLLKGKHV